jgi:peptide/nickel transport system permease protein
MAVVAFVVFSLLYLTPGDPAAIIAGDIATDEGHPPHPRSARPR